MPRLEPDLRVGGKVPRDKQRASALPGPHVGDHEEPEFDRRHAGQNNSAPAMPEGCSNRKSRNEKPAARAGSCRALCSSMQLAAASEAETSESEAEKCEGGGFGNLCF
jgi:hypothetical protein